MSPLAAQEADGGPVPPPDPSEAARGPETPAGGGSLTDRLAALERRHAGGGSVPRPDVPLDSGPQTDEGEAERLVVEHLGAEVVEEYR